MSTRQGLLVRLRDLLARLKSSIVQDVPPDIAYCEYCRKPRCLSSEWERCETRLEHVAREKAYRDG